MSDTTTTASSSSSSQEGDNIKGEGKRKLEHRDGRQHNKKQKGCFPPFKHWKKHSKLFNQSETIRGVLLTGEHSREGSMIGEILHTFKFEKREEENVEKEGNNLLCYLACDVLIYLHMQFVDLFYPHLSGLSPIPPEVPEEEGKDANENKEATAGTDDTKKQKLFEVINSGCSGMAIISFVPKELEPVDFTRRMLAHIVEKKEPRPNFSVDFTNRIIPLEATCEVSPSLERLLEISKPVVASYFQGKPACKYAIRAEHRNCNGKAFDKMKCINAFVPLVDPVHKVDLDNPDLVIMVQVFKSAAGVSVLPDYNKLRKYNIKEVFKGAQDPKPQKTREKKENKETQANTTTQEKE